MTEITCVYPRSMYTWWATMAVAIEKDINNDPNKDEDELYLIFSFLRTDEEND